MKPEDYKERVEKAPLRYFYFSYVYMPKRWNALDKSLIHFLFVFIKPFFKVMFSNYNRIQYLIILMQIVETHIHIHFDIRTRTILML